MSEKANNNTSAYLGIDTSCKTPVVSIKQDTERTVVCRNEDTSVGRDLASVASAVLTQCGLDFSLIAGIAVSTGPGSFTGLRVGLAYAKGLAAARGLALVGVSHFERISACETHGVYDIMVLPMNAQTFYLWRKDEAQVGRKKHMPHGSISVYDSIEDIAKELDSVGSEKRIACYVADAELAQDHALVELISNKRVTLTRVEMTAESLLECGIPEFANANEESWSELEPVYGRKSMAEINFERKGK